MGNNNPSADFNRHFIVKIENVYYDPSYGKKYNSVKEWEESSIDGFFIEEKYKKEDEDWSKRIIRKNTTLTEIKEQ